MAREKKTEKPAEEETKVERIAPPVVNRMAQAGVVRMRALTRLIEGSSCHNAGETFEVSPERAASIPTDVATVEQS